MRKVPEVEEARAVMTEAMAWSVFTWLLRKSEVRATADRANAAVDRLNVRRLEERDKTSVQRDGGQRKPVQFGRICA